MRKILIVLLLVSVALGSDPVRRHLSLDDILSNWRAKYGTLVGHPVSEAIRVFGAPMHGSTTYFWDASEKTLGHSLRMTVDQSDNILLVVVSPSIGEELSVAQVIRRAELFDFKSSTSKESTTAEFEAAIKNGGTILDFDCRPDRDPEFMAAWFMSAATKEILMRP